MRADVSLVALLRLQGELVTPLTKPVFIVVRLLDGDAGGGISTAPHGNRRLFHRTKATSGGSLSARILPAARHGTRGSPDARAIYTVRWCARSRCGSEQVNCTSPTFQRASRASLPPLRAIPVIDETFRRAHVWRASGDQTMPARSPDADFLYDIHGRRRCIGLPYAYAACRRNSVRSPRCLLVEGYLKMFNEAVLHRGKPEPLADAAAVAGTPSRTFCSSSDDAHDLVRRGATYVPSCFRCSGFDSDHDVPVVPLSRPAAID